MQIFISWSGDRSRSLAIQLHEWLRTVIQRAETWMSERDIEVGQRWTEELSARIKQAHFGILCVSPENKTSPWLHFEAGALAEVIGSARVVPILLSMKRAELGYPLAQFQAVEANRDGVLQLTTSINRGLGSQRLDAVILNNAFNANWPSLETALERLSAPIPNVSVPGKRTDRQILEEMLNTVRAIDNRLGANTSGAPTGGGSSENWEDYYIQGVNLANKRGGSETDAVALRMYSTAIALVPQDVPKDVLSRLYAYRGAMFKRLGRLDEARQDLSLARQWAVGPREINDALYNLAGVEAMAGNVDAALGLIRDLLARDKSFKAIVKARKDYFGSLFGNSEFKALVR
jgi:tetratricopeptide (TPR) repeat protein